MATQMVGTILAPILVGILLGQFLDSRFGTQPFWLLVLVFLGIATGLWSMYKQVR